LRDVGENGRIGVELGRAKINSILGDEKEEEVEEEEDDDDEQ
jgi:hypothetical protein